MIRVEIIEAVNEKGNSTTLSANGRLIDFKGLNFTRRIYPEILYLRVSP